jgi:OFA family oxalate/formate antiporter-like MFS transporter
MKNNNIRWFYLIVGVIVMLFAGVIYAWSILKAPFGSEFGWESSQLALNFTITMCFFCIGGMISGMLTKKVSPKVTLVIAAILAGTGFVMVSKLDNSLIKLYLYYGGMCGLGIGMAYNAIIATVNEWFPDKKGLCSGSLMMGFGASALVLGSVASSMIDNSAIGWRQTYFDLGIAIAVILVIAAAVLKYPNQKTNKTTEMVHNDIKNYTTKEMLRRNTFWLFFIYTILTSSIGATVISFSKDLALSIGATAAYATSMVGLLSISNCIGRILCGISFDHLGRKKTMIISNSIAVIAPAIILVAILNNSITLCVVGFSLVGISYGCTPTTSSAFIVSFYGKEHFAMNFSVATMALIPAAMTATLSSSLISKSGSYNSTFIMLICFAIVALSLNLNIKNP